MSSISQKYDFLKKERWWSIDFLKKQEIYNSLCSRPSLHFNNKIKC